MPPSKRGLCWPVGTPHPLFPFTKPGSKISWLYNWSPRAQSPHTTSLEFVPMQWNDVHIEEIGEHIARAYPPSSTTHTPTLIAFNEPDLPSQANMPPQLAAQAWLTHIQPLRQHGVRAGSPGISSAPDGIPWLQNFLSIIRSAGSDVDFLCLHWYGEGLGPFYDYLWSARWQLDETKPVWITEFGCTNWQTEPGKGVPEEEVHRFLEESVKYLDGVEWVERYAWFGFGEVDGVGKGVNLVDGKGGLTPLGKVYRDA